MRQEAVAKLTTLLANKQIVNTPAVAELAGALKDRLGETNLNLRARVVQCIDALVKALNGQAVEFAALLLPETPGDVSAGVAVERRWRTWPSSGFSTATACTG